MSSSLKNRPKNQGHLVDVAVIWNMLHDSQLLTLRVVSKYLPSISHHFLLTADLLTRLNCAKLYKK